MVVLQRDGRTKDKSIRRGTPALKCDNTRLDRIGKETHCASMYSPKTEGD
jgi:hypothetical protein